MREVLSQFPFINLVLVGQLMFFALFSGAIFWVFRSGSKPFYDRLASLPLEGQGGNND